MIVAILHAKAEAAFNRYEISYSSPIPVQVLVEYRMNNTPRREICYLEAGEDQTFSSYIDTYLEGEVGDIGPVNFTAEQITMEETAEIGAVKLMGALFEAAPVIAKETCYIENERYRVGVELAWGGGLSCFEDKKCPVEGLKNMLNYHDTGRLVQQSYYGTNAAPFVCGNFMDQKWCYNPVQGGDRGGFKSKLIECKVGEGAVYIKCRPRDWGQVGGDTYSYMENTYRLDGDCLFVDNRFVDFSGFKHPLNTQEVPAFYTVSYLDTYYFYDGDKPWTGDTLAVRDSLPFWPTDWPACTFHYKEGNTETWSAFVDKDGYGLGLYVPNAKRWLAGRHNYDGSKNPQEASTNYIAPTCRIALQSFQPVQYSYLICAGQLEAIRSEFTARKDDIDNSLFDTYGKA